LAVDEQPVASLQPEDEAHRPPTPGEADSAVVELDGLGIRFGRHQVLDDLRASLTGRCIGLLGPNGAGKTTLIHTLLGFHEPSAGTARVFGHDIQKETRAVRSLIGYMPERDAFIAGMSGVRFVRMMAELSGLPASDALERAHEVFFYVGLGEARYRPLESYSMGMKQLVKLAQAIAHGPRLLFLDEPTNGLDPPARRRMLQLIREIRDSGRAKIVVSSHLLRDVEECCEEVLVLKEGRIATYCNLEEERRANRKFLLLETRGDDGDFADRLRALGCELAILNRRRLRAVLPDGVEIRDLYRIASELGVQVRRLDYKKDSLEDIFLRAMEDDPRAIEEAREVAAPGTSSTAGGA
jgi:ABC-2 type transport system ATP-binding protein